jgi:hypothetical protein
MTTRAVDSHRGRCRGEASRAGPGQETFEDGSASEAQVDPDPVGFVLEAVFEGRPQRRGRPVHHLPVAPVYRPLEAQRGVRAELVGPSEERSSGDETAIKSVGQRGAELVEVEVAGGDVEEGAQGGRHPEPFVVFDVVASQHAGMAGCFRSPLRGSRWGRVTLVATGHRELCLDNLDLTILTEGESSAW